MNKKIDILSVPATEKLITKPNQHFSSSEKEYILQDLISSGKTKQEIWEKYTGQKEEHGNLLKWMRQLGYDTSIKTRRSKFDKKSSIMAVKKSNTDSKIGLDDFETLQLKKRIAELEKRLKDADMKAIAYSTMVDIAEKEFNIPIRKKYNTKS